ncbi:MAG: HD domain-containing protein [Planctomycetia bacterium]|nr:HD domain-containing protein [Planctomycetia bacterium]
MTKNENIALMFCPVHGYIPFTTGVGGEQELIDNPWVQRLRQIHQLQTAWWVFPSAEHTRFQHVLGTMHLASRAAQAFYDSLKEVCDSVPSRNYVESLLRVSGLLHDVGHGPFGHFFDTHFLKKYHLTHESLGAEILRRELGDVLRRVRRNPHGEMEPFELLDPEQVAFLIVRPQNSPDESRKYPRWLLLLRTLFCGLYTVDNMDFVLRDAYMSGFNTRVVDIDRLFYYSFFTEKGLTIDERGLSSLVQFLSIRGELFRTIYFHRTVKAADVALADLFQKSQSYFMSGNPLEHLDEYLDFTEWTLLVRTATEWKNDENLEKRTLSAEWQNVLRRQFPWRMAAEQTFFYDSVRKESRDLFTKPQILEEEFRKLLPRELENLPMRFDYSRHTYRPDTSKPEAFQNFVMESKTGTIRSLADETLFRTLPCISYICRIYTQTPQHDKVLNETMAALMGEVTRDDDTNI